MYLLPGRKAWEEATKYRNIWNIRVRQDHAAEKDAILRCRLAGISDLIAAEGKYYLQCYSVFIRKWQKNPDDEAIATSPRHICFNSLVEELRVGLSRGSIYTMATVWERYCEMLQTDFNVLVDKCDRDNRKNFQNKMKRSLCGKADFVQSLDPQEALLVFPWWKPVLLYRVFQKVAP